MKDFIIQLNKIKCNNMSRNYMVNYMWSCIYKLISKFCLRIYLHKNFD